MKDKVCTDCALLRYNNGICPYFQESFTSEDRACPKFISSLVKCDVCGKFTPTAVWELDGDIIHQWCQNCAEHSGCCLTCNRNSLCAFETDPNPLPKVIQQHTRQGNTVTVTQVKNPKRIEVTCAEKCKCYSKELGCLKEHGCCVWYEPLYKELKE